VFVIQIDSERRTEAEVCATTRSNDEQDDRRSTNNKSRFFWRMFVIKNTYCVDRAVETKAAVRRADEGGAYSGDVVAHRNENAN
jgi:hypothetical protein